MNTENCQKVRALSFSLREDIITQKTRMLGELSILDQMVAKLKEIENIVSENTPLSF